MNQADKERLQLLSKLVTIRDDVNTLSGEMYGMANYMGFCITRWQKIDRVGDVAGWVNAALDPVELMKRAKRCETIAQGIEAAARSIAGRTRGLLENALGKAFDWVISKLNQLPESLRKLIKFSKDCALLGLEIARLFKAVTPIGAAQAGISVALRGVGLFSDVRKDQITREMDKLWKKADEHKQSVRGLNQTINEVINGLAA